MYVVKIEHSSPTGLYIYVIVTALCTTIYSARTRMSGRDENGRERIHRLKRDGTVVRVLK